MPGDHSGRLDDEQSVGPPGPGTREYGPEGSVDRSQPRSRDGPAQDRELLAKREILDYEVRPWASECAERSEDGGDDSPHEASLTVGLDDVTPESLLLFR
jgi:hypothetical protein